MEGREKARERSIGAREKHAIMNTLLKGDKNTQKKAVKSVRAGLWQTSSNSPSRQGVAHQAEGAA